MDAISTNNFFEKRIKPALLYIGSIGAALTSVAYVALVCILIFGFLAHSATQTLVFAIINAIIGLIIMQFLKVQGQDFAKSIPSNKVILDEYYRTRTKDKKLHSIKYFWVKTIITDLITKGISIAFTTIGIIYIVITGSQDYTLLILAFVNLVMFFCFGLLSLSKAYDFFNNEHMAYVQEQLRLYKEQEAQAHVSTINQRLPKEEVEEKDGRTLAQTSMEMGPPQLHQQTNDNTDAIGRGSILEPPDSYRDNSNNQSVVLDSMDISVGSMGRDTSCDTNPTILHSNNTQNT